MRKFEVVTGSAMWIAVSVLMAAAALEPVSARAQVPSLKAEAPIALCADGSARLAMGCESIHL